MLGLGISLTDVILRGGGGGIYWSVASATYTGVTSTTVRHGSNEEYGLQWKDDGTKLFISIESTESIRGFNASTPYDITTLSFFGAYNFTNSPTYPFYGFHISRDGTKILAWDGGQSDCYTMSTPWDISTTSYTGTTPVNAWGSTLGSYFPVWSEEGNYIFGGYDDIRRLTLSTPFNVATAGSLAIYDLTALGIGGATFSFRFNPEGTQMIVLTRSPDYKLYVLDLATPWDVSTATISSSWSYSGLPNSTIIYSIDIHPDGDRVWLMTAGASNGGDIYEIQL